MNRKWLLIFIAFIAQIPVLSGQVNMLTGKNFELWELEPTEVTPGNLAFRDVTLNDPINPDSALKKLFAGNYIKAKMYGEDTISIVLWKCSACNVDSMKGWYAELTELFPRQEYDGHNETIVTKSNRFVREDGTEFLLISFSTNGPSTDFIQSGRFNCGVLGLALFEKEISGWRLVAFDPGLGCFGSFGVARGVEIIKVGKSDYLFLEFSGNGGAGGPYYTYLHAFSAVGNEIHEVLEIDAFHRESVAFNIWQSEIVVLDSLSESFSSLRVVTKGNYDKDKGFVWDDPESVLFPEVVAHISETGKEYFEFELVRDYRFDGSKYRETKRDFHVF